MILYIAEKPSLGRAVAEVLPKPHKRGDGFIRVGNGDVVSWCIGHLLELAPPDSYDSIYKKWSLEHLPIIPSQWKLEAKPSTKKQLNILRKLIKEANELVHVGDPDREGQLLVDEVINFCGIRGDKLDRVQRCLISDLNPAAVKKSLSKTRSNKEFVSLSVSALTRSRADWLYGMNLTRACTIRGQRAGYSGVLSIGRVQSPVLSLVVERDKEIENFQPKSYYEVFALLKTASGEVFKAKWRPSEECLSFQDEDGRVLSKALAENVIKRIAGSEGIVKEAQKKRKKQAAPLPYNLSTLQIEAARRYGLSAKIVLDVCQGLYEKHKLITYPRSDCRYLPEEHLTQVFSISSAINENAHSLEKAVIDADFSLKGKAWNDKKVSAHHAIIPTAKKMDCSHLSKNEQNLYEMIARQYLAQFYPVWQYDDCSIHIEINGGKFVATARSIVDLGWKVLFGGKSAEGNDASPQNLPKLVKGDVLQCEKGELLEKMTQPPLHFTDASLLAAMTGISRYVKDPNIRKILKETDGLGTEATRANIIELLFKRDFLTRKGKKILSTEAGKRLFSCFPVSAKTPDMTAQWEAQLDAISQRQLSYQSFMNTLESSLQPLIDQVDGEAFRGFQGGNVKQKKYKKKKAYRKKKLEVS